MGVGYGCPFVLLLNVATWHLGVRIQTIFFTYRQECGYYFYKQFLKSESYDFPFMVTGREYLHSGMEETKAFNLLLTGLGVIPCCTPSHKIFSDLAIVFRCFGSV